MLKVYHTPNSLIFLPLFYVIADFEALNIKVG
jgi:hypothetical protein